MPDFQTHGDIFAQNRCFSLKSWVAACCTMLHVGLCMSESRNRNLGQLVSFSDSVVFSRERSFKCHIPHIRAGQNMVFVRFAANIQEAQSFTIQLYNIL